MNVIVIEDERLIAQRLITLLKQYDASIHVLIHLSSIEEALHWFGERTKESAPIDLAFMDIHLEDGNSFQIIEQTKCKTPVIFTTAYDEYMIQAFKVNSIDYLLKPINYQDLTAAIEKFKALKEQFAYPQPERVDPSEMSSRKEDQKEVFPNLDALLQLVGHPAVPAYKERFMITVGARIRSIPTSEIAYFYLTQQMVFLVTKANLSLPVDYSLDKLRQLLDPRQFFRVNRQYLISMSAINVIYTFSASKLKIDLTPKPPEEVFVSGDRIMDFKEWLGK